MTCSESPRSHRQGLAAFTLSVSLFAADVAQSQPLDVTVLATDAIHLSGRDDVAIPPLGGDVTGFPLDRPEFVAGQALETRPVGIAVTPGEELSFLASGDAVFSPSDLPSGADGDAPKDVLAVDGIAGYVGPGGSLVGVFLGAGIPLGVPPSTLDFSAQAIGTGFAALAPAAGQVFFIGDGLRGNGAGQRQAFQVPSGVTRLFLGTLDGAVPNSLPGYYVDNDGSFEVQVLPEAGNVAAASTALGLLALLGWVRRAA